MLDEAESNRIVVVSNRLPVVVERDDHGDWTIERGAGGLVTAMVPVLHDCGGLWIGWPGTTDGDSQLNALLDKVSDEWGYSLKPVELAENERDGYYYGFSNECLWPLFHDLQSRANFDPSHWETYVRVNEKFARVVLEHTNGDDFIWVHDYHLINVGKALRERGSNATLAYFLHIPFPPVDIFVKLPWQLHILKALLSYDLIGFQTDRDQHNFSQCIEALLGDARIVPNGNQLMEIEYAGRRTHAGAFPISIDFKDFAESAATSDVSRTMGRLRLYLPDNDIILGVDRLDYTKGIPFKMKAFRNALERFPELRQRIVLVQVVIPSRETVSEYHDLKNEIEQLVGEINGEYTEAGWVPIHYIYRSLTRTELLAYYRTAEVVMATPVKDGMNLVAKEYCACSIEETGVLILSKFAGTAWQFGDDALLVNPYDIEGMADAVRESVFMAEEERRRRMRRLRENVEQHDVFWWVNTFLAATRAKEKC